MFERFHVVTIRTVHAGRPDRPSRRSWPRAPDHELAVNAAASAQRRSAINSLAATAAHADGLLRRSHQGLANAVKLFDAGPRPLALASALEDLGTVTAGNGDTQQAGRVDPPRGAERIAFLKVSS